MDGSVLLIGKETFVGSKLAERLSMEGRQVVSFGSDSSKSNHSILWNRLSYISTKTAIREMERYYLATNEVYIVFGRKRDENLLETSSSFIDDIIDGELKALIYLTQELYQRMINAEIEPAFYFIADNLYDAKTPLSSAVGKAFKTYVQAIMVRNSGSYMAGFELEGDDTEGFLNYILKNSLARPTKKRNTWLMYPKGLKLFGGG